MGSPWVRVPYTPRKGEPILLQRPLAKIAETLQVAPPPDRPLTRSMLLGTQQVEAAAAAAATAAPVGTAAEAAETAKVAATEPPAAEAAGAAGATKAASAPPAAEAAGAAGATKAAPAAAAEVIEAVPVLSSAPAAASGAAGEGTNSGAGARAEPAAVISAAPAPPSAAKAPAAAEPPADLQPPAAPAAAASRLKWNGRWGKWGDASDVLLVACHVAHFDIVDLGTSPSGLFPTNVARELGALLGAELGAPRPATEPGQEPPLSMVVHISEDVARRSVVGSTTKACFKAALLCKGSKCKKLQPAWQGRPLASGCCLATWTSTVDTAGKEHIEISRGEAQEKAVVDSAVFGVPRAWFFRSLPPGGSSLIRKGAHWWSFFQAIFGEPRQVEVCWSSQADEELQLLVQFVKPAGARSMHEMLQGRFFWNPTIVRAKQQPFGDFSDSYPIFCTLGRFVELRSRSLSGAMPRGPAGQPLEPWPRASPAAVLVEPPPLPPPAAPAPVANASPWASPSAPPPLPTPAAAPAVTGSGITTCMVADGPLFLLRRLNAVSGMHPSEMEVRLTAFKATAVVGREDECDLVVRGHHLSRRHAEIAVLQDSAGTTGLWIKDLSTNGIHVNGRRLVKGMLAPLSDQDKLTFEAADIADPPAYRVQYFASAAACDRDAAARMGDPVSAVLSQLPPVLPLPPMLPMPPMLPPCPPLPAAAAPFNEFAPQGPLQKQRRLA